MKKIFALALLATLSFAFQAHAHEADGIWRSPCRRVGRTSTLSHLVIQQTELTLKMGLYNNRDCSGTPAVVYTERGRVDLYPAEGNYQLDFNPRSVTASLHDTAVVERAQQQSLCKTRDWREGEAKELLGRPCERDMGFSRARYHLIAVRSEQLYLGSTSQHPGRIPQERPIKIDESQSLARIQGN